jgi:hypothetical protein
MGAITERFTTPVGRLVQGSVDEPQTKDQAGNLRVVKSGPNAGQPNPQYFIAVAYAKTDAAFNEFYGLLLRVAAQSFPNLFPNAAAGDYTCVHPKFAYKVIDGDGKDDSGKLWSDREGFAGHWVVRFASGYAPRCFHAGRYAANEQIQEKGAIKRGYFVRVSGSVTGNDDAGKPGLFLNLDMVELSGYGPEITSGPDASQAFGAAPTALPAGASAAPITPPTGAPTPGPTLPAAGAGTPMPPPTAAPSVATAPTASPPVAPYTGYMQPPGGPTPGAPAPTAQPPTPPVAPPSAPVATPSPTSGPQMTAAAQGATYAQMIAAGWTDETLRSHGMMV